MRTFSDIMTDNDQKYTQYLTINKFIVENVDIL